MNFDPIIERLSKMTKAQRQASYIGSYVLVFLLFLLIFLWPAYESYGNYQVQIQTLQADLDLVQRQVDSLNDLKTESTKLQLKLNDAKKALPAGKEIPALIANISERGRKVGLEISKFNPMPENYNAGNEFVAEVPISLAVEGSFHDVAIFFDKLSDMDRIVHVKNIDMSISSEDGGRTKLLVEGKAITFRFLSDEERSQQSKNQKKGGRR
jgi:type IV pilus assembly protein PilO